LVRFYDVGYQDGYAHGRVHGLIEGRTLGKEKGYEMWEEVGFYLGSARTFAALLKAGLWAEGLVLGSSLIQRMKSIDKRVDREQKRIFPSC
jgi:hypothetical protein